MKAQSQNFVLVEGELYRKGLDGLLLICLSFLDNIEVMKQVHEGVCRARQADNVLKTGPVIELEKLPVQGLTIKLMVELRLNQ